MRRLLLEHKRAPGDVLVMSALVRDLALAHPGKFAVHVSTSADELWQHNPHATVYRPDEHQDLEHFKLGYGDALREVGVRNRHFVTAFHSDFERESKIHVPVLYPRPDYHLSDEERLTPPIGGRYWVVIAGGKSDFVTKHWIYKRWQQLVNVLRGFGLRFVQLGSVGTAGRLIHYQPELEHVQSLVGQTTLRDMAQIIHHAEGVICPVTCAMHMAAALQKPCVVIAGGREEWWWEAYTNGIGNFGTELREKVHVPHRFLHTIGLLDCCKNRGCWKSQVEGTELICTNSLVVRGQLAPRCMNMITVNHVAGAVMSYYENGTLPPIGEPRPIIFVDGKPRFFSGTESTDTSALQRAFTYAEPTLLMKTAGMRLIEERSKKEADFGQNTMKPRT
jgi:hypothetical protein